MMIIYKKEAHVKYHNTGWEGTSPLHSQTQTGEGNHRLVSLTLENFRNGAINASCFLGHGGKPAAHPSPGLQSFTLGANVMVGHAGTPPVQSYPLT